MKRAAAVGVLALAALPAHAFVQSPPAVSVQPAAPAEAWWYYCPDSRTYYPYAQSCPAGWQRVSPVPEGQRAPR